MPAQRSLTIPEAYDMARTNGDFQLMQVTAESLIDLFFQIEQLPSDEDKGNAIDGITQKFNRPEQRLN